MKKILATLLALVMLFALAVPAFAEENVVFENAEGQAFADLVNPWDFFGTDAYWGREAAQCLSVTWADIKPIMEEGGATFTYVYSGDGAGNPTLNLSFTDGNGNGVTAPFTVADLGDGKYEATVALDDMVKAWTDAGLTLDTAEAFLVQVWTGNFKLYSAKFVTGADAVAPTETTAPDEDDTTAPAEDTTAPTDTAPAAETTEPADTGIVLAVLPMAIAAAAVVISKRK